MIEMKVKGLTLDPLTNVPIVILRETEGERALPIWVGIFEAHAIAREIENFQTPRPMTHDLIRNLISGIKGKVSRIVVNDLKDNTFYAEIYLTLNGSEIVIDSRPSDAIAIALRTKAPIFVVEKVLEEAKSIEFNEAEAKEAEGGGKEGEKEGAEEKMQENPEDVKRWLENLKPEDFMKFEN
ncbi:MAG: bifunctional nuclease family protein [Candidatus Tectomicrobia bacterium]|uniref:Bifunctional nuclease family protein n=1 Tax=Tectimicrobiota bacterium TaxID=2528274 RepID=A0A932MNY1_UNCTE|nr:bifunctional nuclease family protein [Candidatus Tectomicrobia bacterium]